MNITSNKQQIFCLPIFAILASVTAAMAQSVWQANTAGTFDWTNSANWSPSVPGLGDTAVFTNRTGAQTVSVDSNRQIQIIDFANNANAYTLTNGSFLLGSNGIIRATGAGAVTNTVGTPITIQNNNGTAAFTAGSTTANRALVVSGAVSGASSAGGTTVLTLDGPNTQNNTVSGSIGNGTNGGDLRLVKSGVGQWSLSGANTFSGGVSLDQGTLIANSATALGTNGGMVWLGNAGGTNTGLLRISVNNSGTYNLIVRSASTNTATRTINSGVSATRTLTGNIQIGDGSGPVNVLELGNNIQISGTISEFTTTTPGSVRVVGATTDARLAGASNNTYSGATTVESGTLILAKTGVNAVAVPGDLNIGVAGTNFNATVRQDGNGFGYSQLATNTVINFLGAGTNTYGLNIQGAVASTLNLAGLNSAPGITAVVGGVSSTIMTNTLNLLGTGSYSFAGRIANSTDGSVTSRVLALTKAGSGTQTLAGSNSYSGGTTLTAGTLRVGHDAALGTGTLTISNGVFASDGATARTITNAITMGGNVQLGDATGTGALTLSNINLGTATRTLTVSNSTTVAGVITNTGGLTKSGAGTLILSRANNYSGATTINAGVLELSSNGSIAGSAATVGGAGTLLLTGGTAGAVTVNSGGLLAGVGTAGATAINSGGALSIGSSPGIMTFNGNLTLNPGSTSNFEINGFEPGNFDLATGAGFNVSFGGTLNLIFSPGFNTTGSAQLFQFATYSNSFASVNPVGLADGFRAEFNEINGLVTVVPEPSVWGLLGMGMIALLLARRRRGRA